jgi:mRNA-degrading endonuclease toxin of MazEF toxin-antitoxin module
MIDKVQSVAREKLRTRFGKVLDSELLEIERLLALFLGLSE